MMATATRSAGDLLSEMKAVVLYDDFGRALEMGVLLDHAAEMARNRGRQIRWLCKPWQFSQLAVPELAEKILRESLDAALIVVSVEGHCGLPSEVQDWLERWASGRSDAEAAVALWEAEGGERRMSVAPSIQDFVERHGLGFIHGGHSAAESP
jgi:hypothetical protein